MENLLQALNNADRICTLANTHFESEAELQEKATHLQGKIRKISIAWFIGGYFLLSYIVSIFPSATMKAIFNILIGFPALIVGYLKIKAHIKSKVASLQEQAKEESDAGVKILEDNYQSISFLPDDYWYPLATGYLVKVIKSNRTDSLATALDMFDAQLHRWKIEEANAEMVAQQQAQTAYLKSIRTSSKISAAANVTNTMFNIANNL